MLAAENQQQGMQCDVQLDHPFVPLIAIDKQ